MKILFDPQIFLHKFGGISRYFVELISELFHTGIDVALPLWKTTNVYFNENHNLSDELIKKGYYNIPKSRFYDRIDFKGKGRLDRFFRQVGVFNSNEKKFIDYSLNNNYDIVHPTHYDSYFLKYIGTKPFVLTIYDMIHEKFPEYFKCGDVANKKEFLARRASAIIAISDSTKADIIKFLKISEEKIHVVHLASSMMRFEGNKGDLNIPGEYILYTGQRWIYKNFEKFIKACAPILISKDLYLVCTAAKFTKVELRLFEELHISRNVIHMNCSDSLLAALYTNAKLFVFPSLYEGFGIPILEAFRCGCPVALSNTSSLPEIGGTAAEYFDPCSIESIHDTIQNVLENESRRATMIEAGYIRAGQFSWQATAQKTIAVYENILS